MHLIDTQLKQREARNDPIRCGILGAGEMSMGLINQIQRHVPGMTVAALYNRTPEKAIKCLEVAGTPGVVVDDLQEMNDCIARHEPAIVDKPHLLWQRASKIDVVVEMTGTIHEAFEWICAALRCGTKVVSFNAELDATVGPYLQKLAQQHDTKYTLGDGDQPGVTLNLWRQVKMMGFTPLVCGNIKGFLNNHRTPDDQRQFAELYGLSLNMVTQFTDGTKVALEQAAIANATGMSVAKRGMITINHKGHIDELVNRYDIEELKAKGGIVEMVVGAQPGPGVFVFATTDDPVSKRFLKYGKLGDGPLYSFYVPYHLLFFELPFSIARLVDFEDGTLDAERLNVEVVAVAKRDLKAGETLDGLGGYSHYGLCEATPVVQEERLLPSGLAEGKVLIRDVAKDEAISWSDLAPMEKESAVDAAYHDMIANKPLKRSSEAAAESDDECVKSARTDETVSSMEESDESERTMNDSFSETMVKPVKDISISAEEKSRWMFA